MRLAGGAARRECMKRKGTFTGARRLAIAAGLLGATLALTHAAVAQQPGGGAPPQPQGPRNVTVMEIPGVVAAGAQWTKVYQVPGNSADGIVATRDGGILTAQEDPNAIEKIDKNGKASVFIPNTRGVGALSVDSKGRILGVERLPPMAVVYLAPQHKIIADTFDGKTVGALGRLNDLVADKKGGAYFTDTGAYYAAADGKITRIDTGLRTNGIVLSPDQKTLYVTNMQEVVAFDVQPDGSVTNQRSFAKLEAGGNGDGSTIDSDGRIYVSTGPGVQVIGPDGKYLGLIPTPRPIISVCFSGPKRKTLYIVGAGAADESGQEIHVGPQKTGRTIYTLPMIAQGLKGQPK
jgi:gluconolactonase